MKPLHLADKSTYKVVQLYIGEEPVIGMDPIMKHSAILEDLLTKHSIQHSVSNGRPEPTGIGYRVAGMGLAMVLCNELNLYAHSFDYSISIDKEHALRMKELGAFGELEVIVD